MKRSAFFKALICRSTSGEAICSASLTHVVEKHGNSFHFAAVQGRTLPGPKTNSTQSSLGSLSCLDPPAIYCQHMQTKKDKSKVPLALGNLIDMQHQSTQKTTLQTHQDCPRNLDLSTCSHQSMISSILRNFHNNSMKPPSLLRHSPETKQGFGYVMG